MRIDRSFLTRPGFWIMAALVVLLDQWTKSLVQASLPLNGAPLPLIPGVVSLTHVHNPGVAFGQFPAGGPFLILAAVVAMGAILVYRARLLRGGEPLHPLLTLGLALPFGGAVGNVIDRVRIGKVVDFIDFGWWPVFNVADSAITLGALSLVTYFLLIDPSEGGSHREAEHARGDTRTEPGVS